MWKTSTQTATHLATGEQTNLNTSCDKHKMRQKEKLQITFPVQRQLPVATKISESFFFTRRYCRSRCCSCCCCRHVTTEKSNEPATAACSFDVACNVASIFRFVSPVSQTDRQRETGLLKVTAVSLVSHALNQVLV